MVVEEKKIILNNGQSCILRIQTVDKDCRWYYNT